jgi:thioredoxin reductase (NADPH)
MVDSARSSMNKPWLKLILLDVNLTSVVVHAGTEHETHVVTNVMILTPFLKPKMPNIPGLVEHARTVEQVFSLERPPGKTLIVGTSSGALETAGLLARLGYPVTVLVRSAEALRKYDRDVVGRILQSLERHGVVIKVSVEAVDYRYADVCFLMSPVRHAAWQFPTPGIFPAV